MTLRTVTALTCTFLYRPVFKLIFSWFTQFALKNPQVTVIIAVSFNKAPFLIEKANQLKDWDAKPEPKESPSMAIGRRTRKNPGVARFEWGFQKAASQFPKHPFVS